MEQDEIKKLRCIIKSINLIEQQLIQVKMEINKLRLEILKGGYNTHGRFNKFQ